MLAASPPYAPAREPVVCSRPKGRLNGLFLGAGGSACPGLPRQGPQPHHPPHQNNGRSYKESTRTGTALPQRPPYHEESNSTPSDRPPRRCKSAGTPIYPTICTLLPKRHIHVSHEGAIHSSIPPVLVTADRDVSRHLTTRSCSASLEYASSFNEFIISPTNLRQVGSRTSPT